MKQTFYSNGKLLLTSECVVLDGAKALALPVQFGQFLEVEPLAEKKLLWTAYDNDGSVWYDGQISFSDIAAWTPSSNPVTAVLQKILAVAAAQNPGFWESGYRVETRLTFSRSWGLGSSSTLLNNIGQWLHVDPYLLLGQSFGGSGYDIACAGHDSALLYQLNRTGRSIVPVDFRPAFSDQIYFVYLNKKQNSRESIHSYKNRQPVTPETIAIFDEITSAVIHCREPEEFIGLLRRHENLIAALLQTPTVQQRLFCDFNGFVKSLGGWGGDFVMAVCDTNPKAYFETRGYSTVIPFSEIIL